jgi:hypothetical protein
MEVRTCHEWPKSWPVGPIDWPGALARDLLFRCDVTSQKLIGVRHLRSEGRRIPVLLFRNGCGSVAARCLIHPGDTPILDGPSPEAVLALVAGVIDDLLLARGASAVPTV